MTDAHFTFDIPAFRISFPQFASEFAYPDATLQMYWDSATCIIQNSTWGGFMLHGECRYRALTLLTAHLVALSLLVNAGKVPGLVQGATIDKITVTLTPPPLFSQFEWWLSLTPYGQQLLAILQVSSVGGSYYGGLPERSGFRKIGGVF